MALNNFSKIFALLKLANCDDDSKKEIVYSFTNNRTTSLKECTPHEILSITNHLQHIANVMNAKRTAKVKSLVGLCCELHKHAPHLLYMVGGKISYPRIDQLCQKQVKKSLNQCNEDNINDIISYLKIVLFNYINTKHYAHK